MILSAGQMLAYLGETAAAQAVEKAVEEVLRERKEVTIDLGGRATTDRMTDAIISKLQ
jgi:isocitrate dehydrogenase (NAD+)